MNRKETPLGSIPEEWDLCPIGDLVASAQYGLSIRGEASGRYPILRMNCQVDGEVSLQDLQYVDIDDATFRAFSLSRGDVLFNRTNSYELVGRSAIFDHSVPAVFASYLVRLSVDRSRVDPYFINYLLNWDATQSELRRLASRGVSQANISASKLKSLQVHLPKLNEQRAIARTLTSLRAVIRREAVLTEESKALKAAALRQVYSNGLRGAPQKETVIGPLPENWDVVPLGKLGRIGNGSTPKRSVPSYWVGGTYPWLTSAKVYDREIRTADQCVTSQALDECHLPRLQPGAVLVAITGQGKTLGHCAVLRIEATINQHIAYLATDTERANPSFVRGYLETQYEYLRQVASGGGSTKGALTCAFLREVPVPMPEDLEEQREIVALLDAIDQKIDRHRRKGALLDELFKGLLHQLMTGEIRIADRDEPVPERATHLGVAQ